jgi:putative membrane protein
LTRKGPTDINPASTQDLEKLPDVAAAEAQAIIAGSPYANTSDVNEIKLSQLAEQKATDPAVKAFAQKMVAEHNKVSMSMQPFAASWGVTPPTDMDADHQKEYDKLNGLSGADFDKEYIDQMVSDHAKALDAFTTEAKDTKDAKFRAAVI